MAHRLAPRAETDVDEIWYYAGSADIAVYVCDPRRRAKRPSALQGTPAHTLRDDVCATRGSIEIANRSIDTITDRFFMLAGFPYAGRSRDDDFGAGCRSVAVGEYVIVYCIQNEDVLILRVVHGRRDLESLFDH